MTTTLPPVRLASRLHSIPPFHVMELLARAHTLQAEGRDIIHMEVGEPDFPTPAPVIAAAQRFLATGQVRYTPALGLPALREAISGFYATRFGAHVPAERIVITSGASGALLLAIAALTNPGDEWLLTDPGYPCNRQFIQSFNGTVQTLPVNAESNFQPSTSQVEQAWTGRTCGLLLASPSNPTGTLIDPDALEQLAELAVKHGGALIVDEIYQGLVYGQEASTVLSRRNDVFVVNSFSKYFGMTGWRLGWLVVPEGYTRPVEMLAQHLFISAPSPAQHAALAAFSTENLLILEERRGIFDARRKALIDGLRSLGMGIDAEPAGAFYVYANVSGLCVSSMEFAHRLLEQAGVATTPGLDFGTHKAQDYLRVAYTADIARIEEAISRMRSII
ncbi:pyridoxal phosphate-dependent aminotransferase [Uliginosibacterium sp. 31-16]|uniref:pyridoxal phosphate-dependent aminotransferase n=1 Tax=Uliginosibacterium sp. 31-16 TaxID=3068315 RepID=UPI00273F7729|nr:pyridoxal phosphate-dependent aminotransferase [Uliginosibacterium sp. 31-16]MDP5240187.1 pyridoxal phosphate-dependent aminotransferase [Uliginosibacterium sp. 31-16]